MTRALAEMMPLVTVSSRPKGLPMAITKSPTRSESESPSGAAVRPRGSLRRMTAMSVAASVPTTLAVSSRSSARRTSTSSASSTTWLLVRTSPRAASMTKPEPRPVSICGRRGAEGPGSPKKRRKRSSSSPWPAGTRRRLVTPTTDVRTRSTSGASEGRP